MKKFFGNAVIATAITAVMYVFLYIAVQESTKPLAQINEYDECQGMVFVVDNKEVFEESCPKDWQKYKTVHVLSKEAQRRIEENRIWHEEIEKRGSSFNL